MFTDRLDTGFDAAPIDGAPINEERFADLPTGLPAPNQARNLQFSQNVHVPHATADATAEWIGQVITRLH